MSGVQPEATREECAGRFQTLLSGECMRVLTDPEPSFRVEGLFRMPLKKQKPLEPGMLAR